jgi:hypothetical protein
MQLGVEFGSSSEWQRTCTVSYTERVIELEVGNEKTESQGQLLVRAWNNQSLDYDLPAELLLAGRQQRRSSYGGSDYHCGYVGSGHHRRGQYHGGLFAVSFVRTPIAANAREMNRK